MPVRSRLVRVAAAALLAALAGPRSAAAVGFLPAPDALFPGPASWLTSGDGDGDGRDEIVAALETRSTVGILWSESGSPVFFSSPGEVAFPIAPATVALADLDGDGLADLAAAPPTLDSRIAIRLARPGRSFAPAVTYSLPPPGGLGAWILIASDLDGDGDRDLVVAETGALLVLVNRGDGSFDPPRLDGAPGNIVRALVPARLDAVSGIDVLMLRVDGFQAWLNDGSGRLTAAPAYLTGNDEKAATTADLDGDGLDDAVSLQPGATIRLRSDGSGGFLPLGTDPGLVLPAASGMSDVNRDGRADVIAADLSGSFAVLYGDGAGGLGQPVVRPLPIQPYLLALGDFNGDGDTGDVAVEQAGGPIAARVSAGAVDVRAWDRYPTGDDPRAVAAADLDGDGDVDLAVADARDRDLALFLNRGDGSFVASGRFPTAYFPLRARAQDIDGDGLSDLVVQSAGQAPRAAAAEPSGVLEWLRNLGGGFGPPSTLAAGQGPSGLDGADIDGDGLADAVVASGATGELLLLRNTGGGFTPADRLAAGQGPVGVVAADLDGDGDADLATARPGALALFENPGGPGAWPRRDLAAGQGPVGLAAVDLDLDGRPDLAALDAASGRLKLWVNDGGFAFRLTGEPEVPGEPLALAAGDLNCDAAEDLVVAAATGSPAGLFAYLGEGGGTTSPAQPLASGQGPTAVTVADLDRTGAQDPVVVVGGEDELRVGRNEACVAGPACAAASPTIAGADLGCAGSLVVLSGPPGFLRYRWSNGEQGPDLRLALVQPGSLAVGLEVWDARGCTAGAATQIGVLPSPEAAIAAERTLACAGNGEPVRFEVWWDSPRPDPGGLRFFWSVRQPGRALDPQAASTVIEFPAGTAAGDYPVQLEVTDSAGCSRGAQRSLRFVADGPPTGELGNSVRISRAGEDVRIAWSPSPALVHEVVRRSTPVGGSGDQVVAWASDVAEAVDRPPPGSWYYAVVPSSVCGSLQGR